MNRPVSRRQRIPLVPTSWHDRANCSGEPIELFYGPPSSDDGGRTRETEKERDRRVDAAIGLCLRCPVRRVCADDAIERRDVHGIRGGLLPEEIVAERRRRLRQARAA